MKTQTPSPHLSSLAIARLSTLQRAMQIALVSSAALLAQPSAQALEAVWLGGTGNWEDSSAWSTLVVPDGSLLDVLIGNSGSNTTSSVTLRSTRSIGRLVVNSGDRLDFASGANLYVNGGIITNNGTLNLGGPYSPYGYSTLYLGADTILGGSGTTVINPPQGIAGRLINNGYTLTISADQTLRGSGYLGGTGGIINRGKLLAEGGANHLLQIQVGSDKAFDNAGGLVTIANSSLLRFGGQMFGGTIEGVGSAKLEGGNYRDLTLSGTLQLTRGSTISGTITNNGTVNLFVETFAAPSLSLNADTILAGSGVVVMNQGNTDVFHRMVLTNGHTFTIGSGQTMRGSGFLGDGTGNIVNKGLLIADGNSPLTVWVGRNGNTIDNKGGLIRVADGSELNMVGLITGGQIEGAGSAKFRGDVYQDLTLAGTLQIESGNSTAISGTITNIGNLTLSGGEKGKATLYLVADATLAGGGSTVLSTPSNGSAASLNSNNHTLTIGAGHTVRGAGSLGGWGSIVNNGTVLAEGNSPLYVQTYYDKTFDNTNGLVRIADGSALSFNGKMFGGRLEGAGSAKLAGGSFHDLTFAGTLQLESGNSTTFSGSITNNGTLNLNGGSRGYSYLYLGADTTLTGRGSVVLNPSDNGASGYLNMSGHTLTNAADHTVRGAGALGSGSGSIVNQGLVSAAAGTLRIRSQGFDNSQGILHIASTGQMTVEAPLTLADPSLLAFDITSLANPINTLQGLQANSLHGLLNLTGDAIYDGQVKLDFSGYQAQLGDRFTLINTSGSFSGGFDSAWGVGNGQTYGLTILYGEHDVTFTISSISAVPEPSTWALLLSGTGLIAFVSRRRSKTQV